MKILAFDTSAPHCAIAVLHGEVCLVDVQHPMKKGQAENLPPLVEDALKTAGLGLSDLDLIAVGTGPGNFTGIRISVAYARGLSLGLGCPAIGVTGLEALAASTTSPVLGAIAARRGSCYSQTFDAGHPQSPPQMQDIETLDASGLLLSYDTTQISSATQPTTSLAVNLAKAALRKFAADPRSISRPKPFYMRPADAAPPRDPAPVVFD
ncbi:MAG: tRNA (adenosine(37)-N6)-threonylcarbamoyltransferase complex dimerization subunit type 1 TsaB [Halocynthiibacter sp.]